ncbi:hypothetical protein BH23ACT5_BH23ACT5_08390 [soil metagenome]
MYADFVPFFAGAERAIKGPAGAGRVSWVCRDDIADVATEVLLSDGQDSRTYDVTGPGALTLSETAEVLGSVTGQPVIYIEETLEEAWESRRPSGAPDWEIEGWVTSYVAIANGELAIVSGHVEEVTGHLPRALESFLEGLAARPDR